MIVIRAAELRDAGAVAEILNQIIRDTTITFNSVERTATEVADAMAEPEVYLVAERNSAVIGFASYGPFRKGVGYAGVKEHSICLAQDARAAGTGSKLLAKLENIARRQGVKYMVAGVSGENKLGQAFHAKHGYTAVGHLSGIGEKFNRSIDLVLMQKTL